MTDTVEGSAEESRREIGERLCQVRRWCGASQKSLAVASGVSPSTLRRYEKGRTKTRLVMILRLADALQVSANFLLLGVNPPSPEKIAEMRLKWDLGQVPPPQATEIVRLIDGILSQVPSAWVARG
jgi:transcriptional regulator with XRE-family HTH domain